MAAIDEARCGQCSIVRAQADEAEITACFYSEDLRHVWMVPVSAIAAALDGVAAEINLTTPSVRWQRTQMDTLNRLRRALLGEEG